MNTRYKLDFLLTIRISRIIIDVDAKTTQDIRLNAFRLLMKTSSVPLESSYGVQVEVRPVEQVTASKRPQTLLSIGIQLLSFFVRILRDHPYLGLSQDPVVWMDSDCRVCEAEFAMPPTNIRNEENDEYPWPTTEDMANVKVLSDQVEVGNSLVGIDNTLLGCALNLGGLLQHFNKFLSHVSGGQR